MTSKVSGKDEKTQKTKDGAAANLGSQNCGDTWTWDEGVPNNFITLLVQVTKSNMRLTLLFRDGRVELAEYGPGSSNVIPFEMAAFSKNLKYGVQRPSLDGEKTAKKIWELGGFLLRNAKVETISSDLLGSTGVELDIHIEVLLALYFRHFKDKVEEAHCSKKLGARVNSIIFAVPFWFGSVHRTRLRDSAQIAGFGEVSIINELSAACYFHLLRRIDGLGTPICSSRSGNILAFGENSGNIDWAVYKYKYSRGNGDEVTEPILKLEIIDKIGNMYSKRRAAETYTLEKTAMEAAMVKSTTQPKSTPLRNEYVESLMLPFNQPTTGKKEHTEVDWSWREKFPKKLLRNMKEKWSRRNVDEVVIFCEDASWSTTAIRRIFQSGSDWNEPENNLIYEYMQLGSYPIVPVQPIWDLNFNLQLDLGSHLLKDNIVDSNQNTYRFVMMYIVKNEEYVIDTSPGVGTKVEGIIEDNQILKMVLPPFTKRLRVYQDANLVRLEVGELRINMLAEYHLSDKGEILQPVFDAKQDGIIEIQDVYSDQAGTNAADPKYYKWWPVNLLKKGQEDKGMQRAKDQFNAILNKYPKHFSDLPKS